MKTNKFFIIAIIILVVIFGVSTATVMFPRILFKLPGVVSLCIAITLFLLYKHNQLAKEIVSVDDILIGESFFLHKIIDEDYAMVSEDGYDDSPKYLLRGINSLKNLSKITEGHGYIMESDAAGNGKGLEMLAE